MQLKNAAPRAGMIFRITVSAAMIAAAAPMVAAPAHADEETESNQEYLRGFAAFQAGDYRTARIRFLNALKENPNNGLARLMHARTALELGAGVQAQTDLERAVDAGIPAEKVRHLLAHALFLQNERGEALKLLDRAPVQPQFATYAARIRGQIHMADKNYQEAQRAFNRALALGPDDSPTVNAVARFRAAVGQTESAEALIDGLLQKRPNDARALLAKGDLVRRKGDLEAALPYFSRALEIDRNNIDALLERAATLGDLRRESEARRDLERVNGLVTDHPVALYLEAVLETRARNFDRARELMSRTKNRLSRFAPALMLQGVLALEAGNNDRAYASFGSLVNEVPNSVAARKLYAQTQLQRNDPQGALETLKPILDADAADVRVYALVGQAHARSGDLDEAQRFLALAEAESDGEDSGVQTQIALTQLMRGDSALAEGTLREVLRDNDDSLTGLMMLTLVEMQQGNFPAALKTANKIVRAHPDLAIGYNLRGGALLGTGDRERAETSFRQALQKKPDYAEARRNLAQVLKANGDLAGAKTQLRRVISDNAEDTRALLELGAIAGREGDEAEQIEWLQQAAAVDRDALEPRIALADAYLASGEEQRAENEARSLMRDFSTNPQALLTGARVYESVGKASELVPIFRRIVRSEPDEIWPKILLGRSLQVADQPDAAREVLEAAVTDDTKTATQILVELIGLEAREGNADAAARWANRLRRNVPADSNSPDVTLGRALLSAGDAEGALRAFTAASQQRANLAAVRGLAEANVRLGNTEAALATLETFRRDNPRNIAGIQALAELQLREKRYKDAIANYEAARKLSGNADPALLNNLAWAYTQAKDPRAVEIARAAYRLAPKNPSIADTYGWALLRSGKDKERALALLKRAASALPKNADVRYHLAQAYRLNGERQNAVKQVREALKVAEFDSRPQAQRLLQRLQGG